MGDLAEIHVGITTLADDYYIFENPIFEGNVAVIRLPDGRRFEIERSILKPIVKVSTLKGPDEEQNRFIIFPYTKLMGKARHNTRRATTQSISLNILVFLGRQGKASIKG